MANSPSRHHSVDDGEAHLQAEVTAEEHLLEKFYSFMYEDAELISGGRSPSPRQSTAATGEDVSPRNTCASSPRRGEGSPRKNVIAGPPASSLGASSAAPMCAVTREILNAMLPPKYVLHFIR
jgi:hypothetical protein